MMRFPVRCERYGGVWNSWILVLIFMALFTAVIPVDAAVYRNMTIRHYGTTFPVTMGGYSSGQADLYCQLHGFPSGHSGSQWNGIVWTSGWGTVETQWTNFGSGTWTTGTGGSRYYAVAATTCVGAGSDNANFDLWLVPPLSNYPLMITPSATSISQGSTITFTIRDDVTLEHSDWTIDFGDGNTTFIPGNLQTSTISHKYNTAGTMNVNITSFQPTANYRYNGTSLTVTSNTPFVNFTGTPLWTYPNHTVSFTDYSNRTPINWTWRVNGVNVSNLQNPIIGFTSLGNYTIELEACNSYGCSVKTETDYVHIVSASNQHLDLDVKNAVTLDYVQNSQIGIYDIQNAEWRNSTCVGGTCGFMDAGATHQYPLVTGNQYTLTATHPDYNDSSTTVTYTIDHQLVTLLMIPKYGNTSINNLSHLDIDVKERNTNYKIPTPSLSLYDTVDMDYYNVTCASTTGTCGFVHSGSSGNKYLVYNRQYIITASKTGFSTESKTITFTTDHQLETIYLSAQSQNFYVHMDVDIKDSDGNYIQGADYGLYDPELKEWRNATCISGTCGFTRSGSLHERPLQIGNTYTIAATKSGYLGAEQTVKLSDDFQLFTLVLISTTTGQTGTITPVPSRTFASPYPTITTIPTGATNLDISFVNVSPIETLNSGPIIILPEFFNSTFWNQVVASRDSHFQPLMLLEGNIIGFGNNFIMTILNLAFYPIVTSTNFGMLLESIVTAIMSWFSAVIAIIVLFIDATWGALNFKIRLTFFLAMTIDTIYILWTIGRRIRINTA